MTWVVRPTASGPSMTSSLRWILLKSYTYFVLVPVMGFGIILVGLSFSTQNRQAVADQRTHTTHAANHIADYFLDITDRLQTVLALQEVQPVNRTLRQLIISTDRLGFKKTSIGQPTPPSVCGLPRFGFGTTTQAKARVPARGRRSKFAPGWRR